MYLVLTLLLSGCMTTKKNIEKARTDIGASDCLRGLEAKLRENHCSRLEVSRARHEVSIRCMKVDRERKNLWDTWWFRISPSTLKIHPSQIETVEQHTICHDGQVRIEAYPPEE